MEDLQTEFVKIQKRPRSLLNAACRWYFYLCELWRFLLIFPSINSCATRSKSRSCKNYNEGKRQTAVYATCSREGLHHSTSFKNSYCSVSSLQKFSSSIVKSFCIPLKHLFYSCIFVHLSIKFLSFFVRCSVCCLLKFYTVSRARFIVFWRILKVFRYVCFAIDENKKRKRNWEEDNFVFAESFFCLPFVLSLKKFFFVLLSRRMNTKTTYFKILNTNCAEETMKHHDRVREIDATWVSQIPFSCNIRLRFWWKILSYFFFFCRFRDFSWHYSA